MRIYRFSVFLALVTMGALLYVHQQAQLLKISYIIEANERQLASLLDQNRTLVYNITKLKSPVSLEKRFLASKKDFRVPQQWQVVQVTIPKEETPRTMVAQVEDKTPGIFKIFGKPREAFAKTLK